MTTLTAYLNRFLRRCEGQTMAEYVILLTAIAVVVMVAALALGTAITNKYDVIRNAFP